MTKKVQIAAMTRGENVPSARFRIKQLMGYLKEKDCHIDIFDAAVSAYPPESRVKRPFWLLGELYHRFFDVIKSHQYDIVIIQRELISTIPTLEIFTKKPRILDVDDAIWVYRKGWAANTIARNVDVVVAGNKFIADYFQSLGCKTKIIPTAVDTKRFVPIEKKEITKIFGWSGTSGGFGFLYEIEDALKKVLEEHKDWKLRIISDKAPDFKKIPHDRIEFIRWSPENEVSTIAEMDIGLMPIDDTVWSRGKCSYKMLLYMSCSVPTVVSNFGMNKEVLDFGLSGYGVITQDEWYQAIDKLIRDSQLRKRLGEKGRDVVVQNYSMEKVAEQWAELLHSY